MASPTLKFNVKDLQDLSEDLKASPRAIAPIGHRLLRLKLRELDREQTARIPRGATGALRRSLGASLRLNRATGLVSAIYGLLTKRVSARTIVAGNVLQKGQATPRKGKYIWVPLSTNKNITPREFFGAGGFVYTSRAGNRLAALRGPDNIPINLFVLKPFVKRRAPPVPIEHGVEKKVQEFTQELPESIAQVIEARRAALGALR